MEATTVRHIFLKPGITIKATTIDDECYIIHVDPTTYVLTWNGIPVREAFAQYAKQPPVQASDEFLLRETNTKVVKGF